MEVFGPSIVFPIKKVAALATTDILQTRVTGDTFDRFVLNADGSMEWGGGAAATDITAARVSATHFRFANASGFGLSLGISGAAGNARDIIFQTAGVNRYAVRADTSAEGGANAGSNFVINARDDSGNSLRNDLIILRPSGNWTIAGFMSPATDNAQDIGVSDTAGWRSVFLAAPKITKGSGTGYTLNNSGEVRKLTFKATTTFASFAAAALTADKVIATLPAKARILAVYADTTTKYIGGAVATATLRLGSTAGGVEVLASHDVFTAAVTKGLADADLGTSLVRAAAVQGGYMPSFTATTALTARITTTGANTNALTQGSTTWYIECEVLP